MTRIPTVASACIILAATALLGACSSKTSSPEPDRSSPAATSTTAASPAATTPPTPAPSSPAERTEHGGLSECLTSHGVTDSGGAAIVLGPPAGVDPGAWDSAMKECSGLAPGPGPG